MTTAANLTKITAADIARSAQTDDLDDAVRLLQDIAGIDDGGVAAHCFSGFDWQAASQAEREEQLRDWLRTETSYCVTDGEDNFADVLDVLVKNDGACLYWQMDATRAKAALASGAVKLIDDLLVHPDAIEIERGMSYTISRDAEQVREEQNDKIIRRLNWDDPAARLALIESVGVDKYNRLLDEHHKRQTVVTVNGHGIRSIGSRFGQLFMVEGTDRAFATQGEAETFARTL